MIKKVRNGYDSLKKLILANKKEVAIVFIIVLIGAFARLYRIDEYMTFLGDEGRDAIVVRRLLVNFDPILIGPGTSIGNMYLGPLYYYLMAIPLLLANFSPVGPAIMIALMATATIFFVWIVARLWFGKTAALFASTLYSLSPTVIIFSRSSWNPNIMPFFALLAVFSIWKVWMQKKYNWLIVLGISSAFILQSHYLGLLLIPLIFVFWCLTYLGITNMKLFANKWVDIQGFIFKSFIGLILFLGLMSPLVIFDARHDWRNFSAIKTFFTQREATVSIKPWKSIPYMYPIFQKDYVTSIFLAKNVALGKYLTPVIFWLTIIYLLVNLRKISDVAISKNTKDNSTSGFFLTFSWIFVVIVGFGLYKQHIYDHYFGVIFPAIYLLTGALAEKINTKFNGQGKIFTTAAFIMVLGASMANSPLRYAPNNQMKRAQVVAELINKESVGKPFNLAVIATQNYEDGYQYFLEKQNALVVEIDSQIKESVSDQLFVVCEVPEDVCDPTHSPKAEVANFGWSRVENRWVDSGVVVYKLIHSK